MVKKDNYSEQDSFAYDEKQSKQGFFAKHDCELFLEENDIPSAGIQVKRICKGGNEDWKVFVGDKELVVLKGSRFNETEKEYLRSAAGMLFIMNGAKTGWNSVTKFKNALKESL
ncbi:MAG: hypothetical protein RLY43_264 [Bacteroidota bacterium]|jgi:hypothetical protein